MSTEKAASEAASSEATPTAEAAPQTTLPVADPAAAQGQGTIAGAAEALAFTPSAVSQQLSQLQREAGVELLRRRGRRLELTDAGRTLVDRAGELLARVEEIEAELAAQAGEVRGTVRVAAFQTAMAALTMPALEALAGAHPALRVELVEAEAEESLPLLARGAYDVVIAEEYEHAPRPHMPELRRDYLDPDEMLLALPEAEPDGPVALAGLAEHVGEEGSRLSFAAPRNRPMDAAARHRYGVFAAALFVVPLMLFAASGENDWIFVPAVGLPTVLCAYLLRARQPSWTPVRLLLAVALLIPLGLALTFFAFFAYLYLSEGSAAFS